MHPKILQLVDRPLFGGQTSGPDTQNTPPRPLWQTRTFPRHVLVQVMVEGRAFPSYNPLPSMPRLAAAYTPKFLPVQFPGINVS